MVEVLRKICEAIIFLIKKNDEKADERCPKCDDDTFMAENKVSWKKLNDFHPNEDICKVLKVSFKPA